MPAGATYPVGEGAQGVGFAGLIKPQPILMTSTTIVTFKMTIIALTVADSLVPLMSSADNMSKINRAGRLIIPRSPPPIMLVSSGEWLHINGIRIPNQSSTRLAYWLQETATVAAPTAYSRTRSHPMIQAINSPIVA